MTTNTTSKTLALRYHCLSEGTVRCMGDQGKRTTCRHCGGRIYTLHGLWGVYTWRGDGRYPEGDAHRTFVRESAADKYATTNPEYVVRWIHRG